MFFHGSQKNSWQFLLNVAVFRYPAQRAVKNVELAADSFRLE
jgi:hypothetical protein